MTKNGKAYVALLKATEESGWPERHWRDVAVIDAQFLGVYPERAKYEMPDGTPFGWILRDMGSWIVPAYEPLDNNMAEVTAKRIAEWDGWFSSVRRSTLSFDMYDNYGQCYESCHLYFWWDGETLMQVSGPAAVVDRMRHYQETQSAK